MIAFGHIDDRNDARDFRAADLVGGASPDRWSWLDRCAPIIDQDGNSCVGEGFVRAVHTNTVAIDPNSSATLGSGKAAYSLGRAWALVEDFGERANEIPLTDLGSRPRSVAKALREFGVVARSRWDDPARINERIPFDVLMHGSDAKVSAYYRADDGDIVAQLMAAIAAGHTPVFAMRVAQSFVDYRGSVYDGDAGATLGSHMMAMVGYSATAPIPYFEVINSWGTGWGDGGVALISARHVAGPTCRDRIVVVSAPVPA